MHWSLIKELTGGLAEGLPGAPVDIFDVHMHSRGLEATAAYVAAARRYGVTWACNLRHDGEPEAFAEAYPGFFYRCAWPELSNDPDMQIDWWRIEKEWVKGFDRVAAAGFRCFKFKSSPWRTTNHVPQLRLDDERLDALFALCEERGFLCQVHAAQPDCWWGKFYDEAITRSKRYYLEQLENVLARHPRLVVLSVHMGSSPEDLDYLEQLCRTYENYHVDTSATKWVVRELSRQVERARAFFVRWADRICFGSDLVVQDDVDFDYYTSRFHVQRLMWETEVRGHSMIDDPDSPYELPVLNGLGLPREVLQKVYRDNALRLLQLDDTQL